jgi:tetratricopeptide (TPR) repeat protein
VFKQAAEHLSSGRFEEAARGFSEVVKVLPRHVQAYGNLGLAYVGLGDRRQALECLETAISIDPGYQPAIDNRKILMDTPLDKRVVVDASRSVDFYGDRARAHAGPRPAVLPLDS